MLDRPDRRHHVLAFEDWFADDDGNENTEMPVSRTTVTLDATGEGTRMTITSQYESTAQLDQMLEMGMEDRFTLALGQIPWAKALNASERDRLKAEIDVWFSDLDRSGAATLVMTSWKHAPRWRSRVGTRPTLRVLCSSGHRTRPTR